MSSVKNEPVFTVYPNPVSEEITIESVFVPEKIIITNSLGEKMAEYYSAKTLDVSKLKPGIYFLQLFDKNQKQRGVKYFIKE